MPFRLILWYWGNASLIAEVASPSVGRSVLMLPPGQLDGWPMTRQTGEALMNAIQSSILPSGSGNPARTIAGRRAAAGVLALTLLAGVGQAETEPNDRVGEANVAPSSGAVPGVISPAGDVDWYQVTVPGPGRLNLAIVSPPANMRTEIAIYGRHTEWLSVYRSAINSGDDTFLAYDVVTPGAYFVRVRDLNNGISAGSYSLDSTFTAAP
ncbi:MAG: PPC domain-containing protein, partial [Verrucomicrobiae bacterium]|nr:PPC domain-containing protein [Verrucomicrobiae bacterium]